MAKERVLTEKEQKRLEKFNEVSASMEAEGYKKTELTVNILKANLFSIVLFLVVAAISIVLYVFRYDDLFSGMSSLGTISFFLVFLALIVVHELIHGIGWAISTKTFRVIDFGIMRDSLTPYCTCSQPLSKGQYILGAILPLVTLGIIPLIVGYLVGSFYTMIMGVIMTSSAAGDILIIRKILGYRSNAEDIVYMDHPTEAGGVIFER